MQQPHGFAVYPKDMSEPVYKLHRGLWGLEPVQTSWSQLAREQLIKVGFQPVEGNEGTYYHVNHGVVLGLNVDEVVCTGRLSDIRLVESLLEPTLQLHNGRPLHRLNSLEIELKYDSVSISQAHDIKRLLTRLSIDGPDPVGTTLPVTPVSRTVVGSTIDAQGIKPSVSLTKRNWYTYTYNKLKNFARTTRPDLSYALLRLSPRAREAITTEDYAAMWRLLFYVKRTVNATLVLGSDTPGSLTVPPTTHSGRLTIHASTAPTPVQVKDTPNFIGGAAIYLGTSLVHWHSSFIKESPANLSEASMINAAQIVYQVSHVRHLLDALNIEVQHVHDSLPQLYLSDPVAVAQLLEPHGKRDPNDTPISRCYRYLRGQTFPISRDRFLELNDVTPNAPSLTQGLVKHLDRETFFHWRSHARVGLPE